VQHAKNQQDIPVYKLNIAKVGVALLNLMQQTFGYLSIKAQSGFKDEFLNFFEKLYLEDGSVCARALRSHSPIVVEDVAIDSQLKSCWEIVRRANIRSPAFEQWRTHGRFVYPLPAGSAGPPRSRCGT
jgi:hypothetical protein